MSITHPARHPGSRRRRRGARGVGADVARLAPHQLFSVAWQGLRTRRLRAALSALGIAIGIGAMVAVVGVSASSQANLLSTIDKLGTNLLTVTPGTTFFGANEVLPDTAVPMIEHMRDVEKVSAVYSVPNANVFRTPFVPAEETGGIGVDATDLELVRAMNGSVTSGRFFTAATEHEPTAVLGAAAAQDLQIQTATGHVQLFLGGTWFTVIGILGSMTLDTTLDDNVFIGLPAAERVFGIQPNPTEVYVRANVNDVTNVSSLLAPTADPQNSDGVDVSRPSDVLEARAAAKGQFTTLLLGLGAVALLVGAIGIANIMVISVLERRGEIGLRRALGATRYHISSQFLAESALLAALGGSAGLLFGTIATLTYTTAQNEPLIIPTYALIAAPAAGLAIGAIAGLYPATKAARLSPTEALRAT